MSSLRTRAIILTTHLIARAMLKPIYSIFNGREHPIYSAEGVFATSESDLSTGQRPESFYHCQPPQFNLSTVLRIQYHAPKHNEKNTVVQGKKCVVDEKCCQKSRFSPQASPPQLRILYHDTALVPLCWVRKLC